VDRCVRAYNQRTLTAVDAAKAKYWATELQGRVIDAGVRLHADYGYVPEYPVAKALIDARVQRIYGGTNEIMMEIIRRDLMAGG
jgi:acyl-CoA dehydrogenase